MADGGKHCPLRAGAMPEDPIEAGRDRRSGSVSCIRLRSRHDRAVPYRRWRRSLMANPAYVAVDWGTSSFRLWLIDAGGAVLAERRSGEGMTTAAKTGFSQVLEGHLAAVEAPDNLPVIVCG